MASCQRLRMRRPSHHSDLRRACVSIDNGGALPTVPVPSALSGCGVYPLLSAQEIGVHNDPPSRASCPQRLPTSAH